MGLKRRQNIYYIVVIFTMTFIMTLGSWWLYLIFKLSLKLSELNLSAIDGNLISMVKWEGLTFIVLLTLLMFTLLYLYIQDSKKAKTLQVFFSSLTHELKTPLASMRLQAEVIEDQVSSLDIDKDQKEKVFRYIKRLVQDNHRLEDQLENHLQLSRIEQNANLNIRPINLFDFITNEYKSFQEHFDAKINIPTNVEIMADDFALRTIFRNLFKNSLDHSKAESLEVILGWDINEYKLVYQDNIGVFNGDTTQLGNLFYKFNSPNGSGLGLYIIRMLLKAMNGELKIINTNGLIFYLSFQRGEQ